MGYRSGRRGLDVSLGNRHGQLTDAQDVGGAFGDAHPAARVEHVEDVRALEALLEGGYDQPRVDQRLRELEVLVEEIAMERGKDARRQARHLTEGELRLLDLVAEADV